MRPVLVVAATALELRAALGGRDVPEAAAGGAVPWVFVGNRAGMRAGFLLTVTGIGVLNSAFVLGRVLAENDVRAVIDLGVAGSFDTQRLPVGATCVVRREIWPEYGVAGERGVDAEALGFPLGEIGGRPVLDRVELDPRGAARAAGATLPEAWPFVDGLTVSAVTGTPDRARMLRERYGTDSGMFERPMMIESMEGFALAYGCARAGIPLLEIRTISNPVGSRAREDWNLDAGLRALEHAMSLMFGGGR